MAGSSIWTTLVRLNAGRFNIITRTPYEQLTALIDY